jgi:lysophospholipase L1-like esterase
LEDRSRRPSRARLLRALAFAWLGLATTIIAGLAGETWLRLEQRRKAKASDRFSASNVFLANAMELNAGKPSLWKKRWSRYRRGARAEVVAGGERFVVEINGQGYRTHEFEVPKPPGLVRVVCIGASTTVAGRTNEETYPARLETWLRARHPGLPVEVLNLGVSGTTHPLWLGRLDQVLGYGPDLVVHYEAVNDLAWRQLRRFAGDHRWRRTASSSLLFERLFPLPLDTLEPYIADTLDKQGQLARLCRERGIVYLTSSFAAPDPRRMTPEIRDHLDSNTESWGRFFPMHSYATYAAILERYNQRFLEYVQRHHIPHVRAHERLTDPSLFIDVCHFTPEGIDLLAQTFLPAVDDLVEQTPAYRAWSADRAATAPLAKSAEDRPKKIRR